MARKPAATIETAKNNQVDKRSISTPVGTNRTANAKGTRNKKTPPAESTKNLRRSKRKLAVPIRTSKGIMWKDDTDGSDADYSDSD